MAPHTAPVQQIPASRLGSHRLGHLLLAAIVALTAALAIAYDPPRSAGSTPPAQATARTHAPAPVHPWVRARLSHYGEGDGFMWQRTSCGKIVRPTSTFVAALKPELAHCGMKLTILYRGRKYRTTVQDRGAWRSDDRALDAAPGLRARLGFSGVARISYRKGWQ